MPYADKDKEAAYRRKAAKSRFATCKAAGMCARCNRISAATGHTICESCIKAGRIDGRERKRRYELAGLCLRCGTAKVSGEQTRWCSACLLARKEAHANHKKKVGIEHVRRLGRLRNLKYFYGLSPAEWEAMFNSQGRCCAICGIAESGHRQWNTDHDHETDRIRGILCHGCNNGLGCFKDDPYRMARAINYLRKNRICAVA